MINSVELQNILSHRRTRLEIPEGITVIIGPNGAGKTSIVDAISYALFGRHTRGNPRKRDILIRTGASTGVIRVEFSVNGVAYRVEKIIYRNRSGTARLYEKKNGREVLLAQGVTSVENEITRILGIRRELAMSLYITPQGGLEEILDKGKRVELFNSVFGLEKMKKAYENLRHVAREFRRDLENARRNREDLEREARRLREKVAVLPRLEKEITEAREKLEKLRGSLEEYRRLREERDRLAGEKTGLEARIDLIEGEKRKTIERLEKLEQEIAAAKRAVEELMSLGDPSEARRRLNKLLELVAEARLREQQIAAAMERLERLERSLEEAEKLKHLAAEYMRAKSQLEELEEAARRAEHLLRDYERLSREKRLLEETLRARLSSIRRMLAPSLGLESLSSLDPERLEERLSFLEQRLEETIERLRRRLEGLREEKARLDKELEDLEDKLEKLSSASGRCPVCGRELSDEERMALIKKLRREKEEIEKKRLKVSNQIYMRERELEEYNEKLRGIRETRARISRIIGEAARISQQLRETEAMLEEAKKSYMESQMIIQSYNELKKRVTELEEAARRYERLAAVGEEAAKAREELELLTREQAQLRARIEEEARALGIEGDVEAEARRLLERITRLEAEAGRLKLLEEEAAKLRESLAGLEREQAELRAALEEKLQQLAAVEARLEELGDVEQSWLELEKRLAFLEAQRSQLLEEKKRLEEIKARLEKLESRIERLEKAVALVEEIRRALDPKTGAPARIRSRALALMERYLAETLERFNLDITDVRLDEEMEITLYTRAGPRGLESLSGGEKAAVALAFKMALARTAAGRIGAMILDEPTVHLDEERRRELVNIIRYTLGAAGLRQLIVITHDQEVMDAADYIVEVSKSNGESTVKARPAAAEA